MRLSVIVDVSDAVRATRSRTAKATALAGLLGAAPPAEAAVAVAWLSGELPQGSIGVGYATLAALTVAPAPDPGLTIGEVDDAFSAIAAESGPGSAARREGRLRALLGRATAAEHRFLTRLLVGDLRQGAMGGVMVEAIAEAASIPSAAVRRAAMLRGDLAEVAVSALSGGEEALAACSITPGRPLEPMLAQSAPSVAAALERTGPASVEAKVDGARIQVHVVDGAMRAFTRTLKEVTGSIPELAGLLADVGVAAVFDGEVVAFDERNRPLPFQETMSRFGRDAVTVAEGEQMPLTPRFFDCLHLNGRDLIDEPLTVRRQALERVLPAALLMDRVVTTDAAEGEAFLQATLAAGHEGVVVKSLASGYEAGRRGALWFKVKPVHTLDLVVLAAEWGSGRRRGFLSNLHLGARDRAGGFVMLGKTFKGLTDEMLEWQTRRFLELEIERRRQVVVVRPEQVVEVAFDGVQASTRYPGGMTLRFARIKGYRHDKAAGEADTIDRVREIYLGRRRSG